MWGRFGQGAMGPLGSEVDFFLSVTSQCTTPTGMGWCGTQTVKALLRSRGPTLSHSLMRRTVLLTGIFEHYLDLEGEDSVFYPYEALFNRWVLSGWNATPGQRHCPKGIPS